jgi:hypothetical protein
VVILGIIPWWWTCVITLKGQSQAESSAQQCLSNPGSRLVLLTNSMSQVVVLVPIRVFVDNLLY